MTRMRREQPEVCIVNNIPAPFLTPLFRRLREIQPEWRTSVIYIHSDNDAVGWDAKKCARTASEGALFLDSRAVATYGHDGLASRCRILLEELQRKRPDYIVCYGYAQAPQVMTILWSMITGTAFALIGDANGYADRPRLGRRLIKRLWLRTAVRRAASIITIGAASRKFWSAYGAKADRTVFSPFAVDNEYFSSEGRRLARETAKLRGDLGGAAKTVFVYVGRLIARKNVDVLIEASRRLDASQTALLIVGDGRERSRLEAAARDRENIVFTGTVDWERLPLYYAVADVLVLPASEEPWGLVVNEAMASGLAIIAHKHVGAAVDLVDSGNGIALQGFSVEELSNSMEVMTRSRESLAAMGRCSRERIASWNIDAAVRGLIAAVQKGTTAGLGAIPRSTGTRK